jgi:putative membrane protein
MKLWSAMGLLLGLAMVAALVAWRGLDAVAAVLVSLGWGLALLPLAFLPHLMLSAESWRFLFPAGRAAARARMLAAAWIGFSVDILLPLASIGGELAKVRVLMQAGIAGTDAGASVVADKTVQAISLVLWSFVGIVILVGLEAGGELIAGVLAAAVLLSAGIAGFIAVQHAGGFGLAARLVGKAGAAARWSGLVPNAEALDATIRAIYRRPGRFAWSCLIRLLARVVLTGEIWLAAWLMGHGITLWEALMLKSLTGALRGLVFVVPGAWGVQEGGYVLLGALVGLSPELMLAVSLATRARELAVSLPGLLAWQAVEGRSLWRRGLAYRRGR